MALAEECMCYGEVDAFWALFENLTPRPDITFLTLHLGFEACCLNPFVLHIPCMNLRQGQT